MASQLCDLPRGVIDNIASLTDAITVSKLMCVCTDLKTKDLKDVGKKLATEVTKRLLGELVEEVKKFEVIRNDPMVFRQFVVEYLTKLLTSLRSEYLQGQISLHYVIYEYIHTVVKDALNTSRQMATEILFRLCGFPNFPGLEQNIEEMALNALQEYILGRKSKYTVQLANTRVTAYIKVVFTKDKNEPTMIVSFFKSSNDRFQKVMDFIAESDVFFDKMKILRNNIETEDFLNDDAENANDPLDDNIDEQNDAEDAYNGEGGNQGGEEDDDDTNPEYIANVLSKIPSAVVIDGEITFDVTDSNLDGIVSILHEVCGDGVFLNAETLFRLLSVEFLSLEDEISAVCFGSTFEQIKNKYLKMYFETEDQRVKLNIERCL